MRMSRFAVLLLILLLTVLTGSSPAGAELTELTRAARFETIVARLADQPFAELSRAEQHLFIEGLVRTGETFRAATLMKDLLREGVPDADVLTLAGIVSTSTGDLARAEEYLTQALRIDPHHPWALTSSAMLMLYRREFDRATELYDRALAVDPNMAASVLFLRLGIKIRQLTGDRQRLTTAYQALVDYHDARGHQEAAARYAQEIDLLRASPPGPLLQVHTTADRVELPLVDFAPDVPYKCLLLEVGGVEYRILLDTGNAPGWTIHHPDLLDTLTNVFGGTVSTSTGSVETAFESRSLLTASLDFGPFRISRLQGLFFAKPREAYFDANLNPIFIRNRVVTMDYVNNRFLLRTKERFEQDLAETPAALVTRVPFYGWEWPFVPVQVNGYASTLAMIETGAEDVAVTLEFARFINMPVHEAVKEFRGKEYSYHQGSLDALIGTFLLHRPEVEVWPRRFYDTLTGLSDAVMIGPLALEGTFILHFDPFANQVVLQVADPR
jgi:hypothetical protein